MSTRTEHYHEASAPKPNSLVPAASAIVADDDGRILLQRRRDSGYWALPGGTMNLGESISQTVVREVEEETGLRVEPTGLVGIYTDPDHIIEYSDGEVRQQFNVCYTARVIGGSLAISDESTALRFVAIEELDSVPIHESTKMRIDRFIARIPTPHLG
jgi:ADP-ribose pyrophosphatase YjhB (NUDIX family)